MCLLFLNEITATHPINPSYCAQVELSYIISGLIPISHRAQFLFFIFHPSYSEEDNCGGILWFTLLPKEHAAGDYGQDWFPIK